MGRRAGHSLHARGEAILAGYRPCGPWAPIFRPRAPPADASPWPDPDRARRRAIFDVVVDARRGSPTFGHWEGFQLDDAQHRPLYCPDGFAHGFSVLSDVADVVCGCTTYYDPELEGGFAFDDADVAIEWPRRPRVDRVRAGPRGSEAEGDRSIATVRVRGWVRLTPLGFAF